MSVLPAFTLAAFGDGAVRMVLPPQLNPRAVLAALRAQPQVVDVVVTERHACVYFDPAKPPRALLANPAGVLAACAEPAAGAAAPRVLTVRVAYDGPDLARVAEHVQSTPEAVVAWHAARFYTVRVVGFMPGFAYLGEVDERIAAPRLATPRTRVPAGAVGIAGQRTGIYPFAAPGGWNLIGRAVDFAAFTPQAGATLRLGDQVRFERV